ncbi:MAG: hypothetical protein ACI81O_000183 [Cyclobacteriaceae bacterium]|jgi:hypothetical protein
MLSIACGYDDTNDEGRPSSNAVFKMLSGRDAIAGQDLASQPTLSRFENGVRRAELLQMSGCHIGRSSSDIGAAERQRS